MLNIDDVKNGTEYAVTLADGRKVVAAFVGGVVLRNQKRTKIVEGKKIVEVLDQVPAAAFEAGGVLMVFDLVDIDTTKGI